MRACGASEGACIPDTKEHTEQTKVSPDVVEGKGGQMGCLGIAVPGTILHFCFHISENSVHLLFFFFFLIEVVTYNIVLVSGVHVHLLLMRFLSAGSREL